MEIREESGVGMDSRNECKSDVVGMAAYRSRMYRMAASVFAVEPSLQMLEDAVAGAAHAKSEDCILPCERALLEHLAGLEGESFEVVRTRIATEYAELFVGPRPPLAPLYESLYAGYPRRLFSETTAQVRRFYQRFGLAVEKRNQIPDDHISFELEFLADLCEREAQAQDCGDAGAADGLRRAELEFIALHLGLWIGDFADRIEDAWCGDYYAAWSRFAAEFVAEDDGYLQTGLCDANAREKANVG